MLLLCISTNAKQPKCCCSKGIFCSFFNSPSIVLGLPDKSTETWLHKKVRLVWGMDLPQSFFHFIWDFLPFHLAEENAVGSCSIHYCAVGGMKFFMIACRALWYSEENSFTERTRADNMINAWLCTIVKTVFWQQCHSKWATNAYSHFGIN